MYLCQEQPLKFAQEILPLMTVDINTNKDEEIIQSTATCLDAIADLKVVKCKHMLELADTLIHHLRMFN